LANDIKIEEMLRHQQIELLIKLCPRLEYLEIDYTNNINLTSLLQCILIEYNNQSIPHLHSLCFHVPAADDMIVQKIDHEKLLNKYKIKRVFERILFSFL
jgi:hypothetical protein